MSIDSLTPSTANADYPADWERMFDLSAANRLHNQRQKALTRLGLDLWTGSEEQVAVLRDITLEQEKEQERERRQAQHG